MYFTDERAQDAVGTILTDTSSIDVTYNDLGNAISADLTSTGVAAGTYNNVTVNTQGRITAGSLISYLTGAITSLNGLTAASQTFITGTTGTDFTINSSGSTHTFNIPDASATARGLITTGTQSIAGDKTYINRLFLSNGTAAAPSLSFASDTDTGLYHITDNFVSFVTGGTNRLRISQDLNDPLDTVRVIIGTGGIAASKPDALARDQLYVFGRINSSWNVVWEDFLGRGVNQSLTVDGVLTSNIYFDEVTRNSGQAQIISSPGLSGIVRLDNPTSPNAGENEWLGSGEVLVTEVSLNPVFESRVVGTTNNNHRIIAGFADLGVGAAYGADTNQAANEIFFRKNAAGTTWIAVTRSASGAETTTNTGVATGSYHTLRIEVNGSTSTVYFVIDGTVVATHTTGVPSAATRLGYYIGNAISTGTNRATDIDYIRVWSDDPASLPEKAKGDEHASEQSAVVNTATEVTVDQSLLQQLELPVSNEPVIEITTADDQVVDNAAASENTTSEITSDSTAIAPSDTVSVSVDQSVVPVQEVSLDIQPEATIDQLLQPVETIDSAVQQLLPKKINKETARSELQALEEQDINIETFGFKKFFLTASEIISTAVLRIGSIIADRIVVKQLCVVDDAGGQICFTKNELDSLVNESKNSGTGNNGNSNK